MIFFNAVCDVEGCKTIQPLYFESGNETFGVALKALEDAGWRFHGASKGHAFGVP